MLRLSPSAIHVHESHVGGGFGVRGELYPEDVLVCVAAKRFKRPVKWIEDRREHLIAANHSREQAHKICAAVDAKGVILAIDDRYFHDQGAYVRTHAARVVHMTAGILPGPYRVPAYRAVGHFASLTRPRPRPIAHRDVTRPPSYASGSSMRSRTSSRSIGSSCAAAMPSGRPKCRIRARLKRSARKSNTTAAIIPACSKSFSP